jgi:hypothetical protein
MNIIVIQQVDSSVVIREPAPKIIQDADNTIIIRMDPIASAQGFGGPEFNTPDNSAWLGII